MLIPGKIFNPCKKFNPGTKQHTRGLNFLTPCKTCTLWETKSGALHIYVLEQSVRYYMYINSIFKIYFGQILVLTILWWRGRKVFASTAPLNKNIVTSHKQQLTFLLILGRVLQFYSCINDWRKSGFRCRVGLRLFLRL
jgi:hypothetical protein